MINVGTVKLYGPRVLIKIDKKEEKKNGLFMPGTAQMDAFPIDTASVLAIGDGYWVSGSKVPVNIEVGDRVILPTMAPKMEVELIDGSKAYIVSDAEIAASI